MKRFFQLLIIMGVVIVVSFNGFVIQNKIYDDRISSLALVRDEKQNIAHDLIQKALHTDTQSSIDKQFLNQVFRDIFTFYDMDGFYQARNAAVEYGMPSDFVNSFYDTSELDNQYAESMIDVICQYDSADFYLLDRSDDIGYYYVTVKLDTVKYTSGRFELGFFIDLKSSGNEFDRFESVIYYNIV